MKLKICLLSIVVLLVAGCASRVRPPVLEPLSEGPLSVVINVEGIKCCDGVMRLALYHDEAYWMSNTHIARGRLGFIQGDTQRFEIHGLPAGRYAVAVYQDVNSNNKLDRWFWTVPREPYGFSNNVGQYGPVSYEKAAFDLTQDSNLTIRLNSW